MSASGERNRSVKLHGKKDNLQSLAKKCGRDWGLLNAAPRAFAVTRPIFLRCSGDRLLLLDDEGSKHGKEIRFTVSTHDSIDELVSSLWQHMKPWGIAGKGMYWRPVLVVTVEPGGIDRYADIKALLADSGFDVREAGSQPTVARPPAATTKRR